ncbi:MAG: flagellar hook-length control protein FliK, partial [Congregibacter sp.]|nr:flagellar hook-length control protein FliK [Congregibacter sp.]
DGAGELARTLGAAPRADAPPTLSASVTIGALAPTATAAAPVPTGSSAALPEFALARTPDDADFPGELTARMKTLVRDGVREARLQLHPAELGRLQVTVITEGDQTRVAFTVENAAAREAIEQSLPRLKEMLEQSGLQLAQSDVGQQDPQGEARRGDGEQLADGQQNAVGATDADATDADATTMLTSALASLTSSRIDTYI